MKKYIPNQHGAWAMLVLPFLLGVAASKGQFIHIPLFICWLLIYLFSFPLLQGVKTGSSHVISSRSGYTDFCCFRSPSIW